MSLCLWAGPREYKRRVYKKEKGEKERRGKEGGGREQVRPTIQRQWPEFS